MCKFKLWPPPRAAAHELESLQPSPVFDLKCDKTVYRRQERCEASKVGVIETRSRTRSELVWTGKDTGAEI